MAKTKKRATRDGSKSKAIRDYVQQNPDAKHGEVVQALKANGVAVSYNLVANVRGKASAAGGLATRGGASKGHLTGNGRTAKAKSFVGSGNLDAAIHFIRVAGGLDAAKAALATIEEIKAL